jgi:hypothetical protein
MAPGPNEGLLGNVLGLLTVSDDALGEPKDPALEEPNEGRRRLGVRSTQPGQQLLIRRTAREGSLQISGPLS